MLPRFTTLAVRGYYDHEEAAANRGALSEPAYLTTAESFASTEELFAAGGDDHDHWVYARRGNPTTHLLENTVAALEGYQVDAEVSAAVTTTGMTAVTAATTPLLSATAGTDPNIVASSACYGSTTMLFNHRYGDERGVDVRWVDDPLSIAEWAKRVDENTRFLYAESPSNPVVQLADLRAIGELAREAGIPLIVDATLATPALMRPLGFGADVVVHSLTKAAGASGRSMGGAVIARRDLRLRNQPEELTADYAGYLRMGPMRDTGSVMTPFNAWTILADIRELRGRVDAMSATALAVAEHLAADDRVAEVFYPGLPTHTSHDIAKRDMWLVDSELDGQDPVNRYGFLLCFRTKGGTTAARAAVDRFRLIWRANNLGQVKSTATIPAGTTHSQVGETGPGHAPVPPDMVRLSIGLEHLDDIIDDLDRALA